MLLGLPQQNLHHFIICPGLSRHNVMENTSLR